jgi:hypothetical protein
VRQASYPGVTLRTAHLGNPKIGQEGLIVVIEQDIRWLDVAVDRRSWQPVEMPQRNEHPHDDGDGSSGR